MREPGNDPLRGDIGIPANTRIAASPKVDPVLGQRAGIGKGLFGVCRAQVPEPAKTVQHFVETEGRAGVQEWRVVVGFQHPASERIATLVDFVGDIGIGDPQIRRRDDQSVW